MDTGRALETATAELVNLLHTKAYVRREKPFQLSAGGWSHDYVDCRAALSGGEDLRCAARAVIAIAVDAGLLPRGGGATPGAPGAPPGEPGIDAAGGLTMGADPLAHAFAMETGLAWFSVRKGGKDHGTGRRIEGATVQEGTRVLLLEDTVTTGSSILTALEAVEEAGGTVVLAVALLDRGHRTATAMAERHVPYRPVATFRELDIEPID